MKSQRDQDFAAADEFRMQGLDAELGATSFVEDRRGDDEGSMVGLQTLG